VSIEALGIHGEANELIVFSLRESPKLSERVKHRERERERERESESKYHVPTPTCMFLSVIDILLDGDVRSIY
jgi:hypothetical protein